MKRFIYVAITIVLVAGLLFFAKADVNHGHGEGHEVEHVEEHDTNGEHGAEENHDSEEVHSTADDHAPIESSSH